MKIFWNRITNDKGTKKSYAIRLVVCLILALFASLLAELSWNRRLLRSGERSKEKTPIIFTQEEDVYTCSFEYQYIERFGFSYNAEGSMTVKVSVNIAQPGQPENMVEMYDVNNQYIRTSIFKVCTYTNKIVIEVPEDENVEVTSTYIDNRFVLNGRRMLVVMALTFCLLFVLCFSTIVRERVEIAFAVLALGLGMIYIAVLPTQKNAWDECVHFASAYRMTLSKEVGMSEVIKVYADDTKVLPLNPPTTSAEYDVLDSFLDANAIYDKSKEGVQAVSRLQYKPMNIGYVAPGLGISIARLLKLPFSDLYRLGKIFNLLLYVIVVYFAIKRVVVGKRIMLVLALMPTLIMTAVSYSRDATLNAFAFLGMSYILSIFIDEEQKITWKDYITFAGSVFIVSAIKAVYAPFLLLILFVPKERFKDKKTCYIMKFGVLAIALLLVASFVLPVTLSATGAPGTSEIKGDHRGGNTSSTKQLQFIFANIFTYARMLLESIQEKLLHYTIGIGSLGEIGHRGVTVYTNWLLLTMAFVALTDRNEKKLRWNYKIVIAVVCFVITCFIWTSMYLSFTEVGEPVIAGVQGRYFIPLVFPLLLVFNSGKIRVDYDQRWYNTLIMANVFLLQYYTMYDLVIFKHCM